MVKVHTVSQDTNGQWCVLKNGEMFTVCMSEIQAKHLLSLIQQPELLPPDDNTTQVVGELIRLNRTK